MSRAIQAECMECGATINGQAFRSCDEADYDNWEYDLPAHCPECDASSEHAMIDDLDMGGGHSRSKEDGYEDFHSDG